MLIQNPKMKQANCYYIVALSTEHRYLNKTLAWKKKS